MSIINVSHLSFGYAETQVLRDLFFDVGRGQFFAIVGPNGSGKSTLLNLLCAVLKPNDGTITIDSKPIESYSVEKLASKAAVVRQEFVPVFDFSVFDTVMMARTPYFASGGFESKLDIEIVNKALEDTDTMRFASRSLNQLSGGERQRVFIARAFAQNTDILLLDEPTSFLDLKHQVVVYDLLKKMQLEANKTILLVTHDINLVPQYCDEVLLLGGDKGYRIGRPDDVFQQEQITNVFGVKTFVGSTGKHKFFLPLGKFAQDNNPESCNQI